MAVLLKDNAKAVKVLEALRRLDLGSVWVTSPESLPLSAKMVVLSREEGLKPPAGFKTVYVEDYASLECLALHVASGIGPPRPKSSLAVAIDPGQRLGIAYVVDGRVVRTCTYSGVAAFERDLKLVVECLGEGRQLAFYIGYRPEQITHELVTALKRRYPGAVIQLLPEEGKTQAFEGLSRDEEAALKIYFRAVSENV